MTLIETGGLEPLRKVIDVSGDGKDYATAIRLKLLREIGPQLAAN